jgi:hypothetical protein
MMLLQNRPILIPGGGTSNDDQLRVTIRIQLEIGLQVSAWSVHLSYR